MPRRIAYLSHLRSADDPSVVARIVARSRERNAALGHVSFWREADRTLLSGDAVITTGQESV